MSMHYARSSQFELIVPGLAQLERMSSTFHLRSGSQYLHWSGGMLTDRREHAWSGTETQAAKAREVFAAARECKPISVSL